jgi:hypothetical protein
VGNPQGHSEIVVLDHVSPGFIERLAAEAPSGGGRQLTSLELPRATAPTGTPSTCKMPSPPTAPAVTAQNSSSATRAKQFTLEPWWAEMLDPSK